MNGACCDGKNRKPENYEPLRRVVLLEVPSGVAADVAFPEEVDSESWPGKRALTQNSVGLSERAPAFRPARMPIFVVDMPNRPFAPGEFRIEQHPGVICQLLALGRDLENFVVGEGFMLGYVLAFERALWTV